MRAARTASAIRSAASTLPPGVSMSRKAAAAPPFSASRMLRETNGARPFSIVPITGIRYTVWAWAEAGSHSAVSASINSQRRIVFPEGSELEFSAVTLRCHPIRQRGRHSSTPLSCWKDSQRAHPRDRRRPPSLSHPMPSCPCRRSWTSLIRWANRSRIMKSLARCTGFKYLDSSFISSRDACA